ncbi:hypothetical protein FRC03_005722 [Tulasnella sp. 419]|nr:hypothetical protein FRC03_005722 [Tulasnella sp. 419]
MPAQELSRTIQGAGSNRYKAPELLSEDLDVKERSKPTDVYAFGGTIFEIATDHVPYYGLNERKLNDILSQGLLPSDFRQNYSHRLRSDDPLWDLMNECWDVQPEKRPTMLQIKDRLGTLAKGN